VLVPAPPAVLPFAAFVCIGCPVLATWHLPRSLSAVTADDSALSELRRALDKLPETKHPLGL
jgi:hypothetical protein